MESDYDEPDEPNDMMIMLLPLILMIMVVVMMTMTGPVRVAGRPPSSMGLKSRGEVRRSLVCDNDVIGGKLPLSITYIWLDKEVKRVCRAVTKR
jgi:hypothetical protein